MPESYHPRKTEKDVAESRFDVAKYDRGWKFGGLSYVQEHDHSRAGEGGEVLNPEQLLSTAGDGDTWESTLNLLQQGYVVASNGKVYGGSTAVQDAINDVGGHSTVLVGDNTYDPVTIDGLRRLTLKGLVGNPKIEAPNSNNHALTLKTDSNPMARNRFEDIRLSVPQANNLYDCLHIEATNSMLYECWFDNIELGDADRHGVNLVGNATVNPVSMWFKSLFGEGIAKAGFKGNQYVGEVSAYGVDLDAGTYGLDWDGYQLDFRSHKRIGDIILRSNSIDNVVDIPGSVADDITNNGSDNTFPSHNHFGKDNKLGPFTFGPKTVSGDLKGSGINRTIIDGGTTNHALILDSQYSAIENLHAQTTNGAGNAYDAIHCEQANTALRGQQISNIVIGRSDRHGMYVGPSTTGVVAENILTYSALIDNDDLHIDGDNNIIIGFYSRAGAGTCTIDGDNNQLVGHNLSVTDNGTGNTY